MGVRLSALQERILLELSGQGRAVSVRDLCDVIGMDPADWKEARYRLWMDDMIKAHYSSRGSANYSWSITWIGERWLADRPEPSPKPVLPPATRRRRFGLARRVMKVGE
jgi:hypothetical protein